MKIMEKGQKISPKLEITLKQLYNITLAKIILIIVIPIKLNLEVALKVSSGVSSKKQL